MARTRKVGLSEYEERFRGYRQELVVRDPFIHDLVNHPYLYQRSSDQKRLTEIGNQFENLRRQIALKWLVDVFPMPPPYEQLAEELRDKALQRLEERYPWGRAEYEEYALRLFSKGARPTCVLITETDSFLHYTFNRGCVGPGLVEFTRAEAIDAGFTRWGRVTAPCDRPYGPKVHPLQCLGRLGLSVDDIHTINFEVSAAYVTGRNLQDIMVEMKKILRTVFRRTAHRNALDFMYTITPKAFRRAITAYDLHMCEMLPFAEIARRKQWSPDQVERNVKRIYRAVYRTNYIARRRRLDTPAQGVRLYNCPAHQRGDCPEGCQYMNSWYRRVNRALPTDTTGSGRRFR